MLNNFKIRKLLQKLDYSMNNNNLKDASNICDQILFIDSSNPQALFFKARILVLQNNVDGGMDYYYKALQTDYFDVSKWVDEVMYYGDGDIDSNCYQSENRDEICLELSSLCLDKYQKNISLSIYKSQSLCNLGKYEESLDSITLGFTPEDGELYLFQCLGQCFPLNDLERWDDLLIASSNGLNINPEDPSLNYFKGLSLYYLGRINESEGFFNKYLLLTNNSKAYYYLSKIEFKRNSFKKALKLINQTIEISEKEQLESEDAGINDCDYFLKSLILYKLRKFDEAIRICDCLIEKEPENAKNHCLKAMILFEEGDYEESLGFIQKALDLNPDCEDAIELKDKIEIKLNNS